MACLKKISLSIIAFACCIITTSQVVPYKKYTSKDGLIADRITSISQDNQGFMWFGSYFGLCRYNGISFEKIRLPFSQQNKYVTFISPANDKIYAGFLFNGGLLEYDKGKINSWFIQGQDSAASNGFVCMTDDGKGSILLCNSSNQLFRFSNGRFTLLYQLRQPSIHFPRSMIKDRFNNLWIGTAQGLYILPYPYNSAQLFFPQEHIFSLVKNDKGMIFLYRYNGKTTAVESSDGWQNGFVSHHSELLGTDLLQTQFSGSKPRDTWGIHRSLGLFMMNDHHQKTYYPLPLDPATEINTIYTDREHNIWIASEPGLVKVSNFKSRLYLFDELATGGGSFCKESDSALWVCNSKALYHIEKDRITKIPFVNPPPGFFRIFHTDTNKDLWIGSWEEGLWKAKYIPGKPLYLHSISQSGKTIRAHSAMEDQDRNTWVIGVNGLLRIRNGNIKESYQPLNAAGLPSFIVSIAVDNTSNTLWLGDNAQGIIKVKYRPRKDGIFDYTVELYITLADGLSDNYIRSLHIDHRKQLWVGTRFGGIYTIRESGKKISVANHNISADLTCTRITGISQEDSTALWFAACDGIFRYSWKTGKWDHYNTSDGILNAEVYDVMADSDGKSVWSLSAEGVTRLLTHFEKNIAPLVNITAITVAGNPDTSAFIAVDKQYRYTRNSIGFNFAGASFMDEKKIVYRYMLEGYDKSWIGPIVTNNVNYASLPPGKYVFNVMAANASGQWSEQPASFAFEIILPFYKRAWFIFIVSTAILFIISLLAMERLKQKFRIEKLRLTIARDLHDDIGSTLGSINLMSKTATRKLDRQPVSEDIAPIFQKIGQSAETTLEAMDDIVWSINPSKDKIHDLVVRMKEFANPLLEGKDITMQFHADIVHSHALPMNLRRNVFLIFKEAIYNILKHSDAGRVDIYLHIHHQRLLLEIKDNGKGFDQQVLSGRNGLMNMDARARMVNGTIQVDSSGEGTKLTFSAPLR